MKKVIVMLISLAFVIAGTVTFVNAATISIHWENTVDSAVTPDVWISPPGTYDISLWVSGIEAGDNAIFELQFDLVAPTAWVFGSDQLSYGPAVDGWVVKMGGVVPNAQNSYREFSAEWMDEDFPLQEGLLVSGLTLTIPVLSQQMNETLAFGAAAGAYAQYLEFADLRINAVPIPGAVWLLGSGLIGLVGIRRRFLS